MMADGKKEQSNENEEDTEPIEAAEQAENNQATSTTVKSAALPLKRKYYTRLDDLIQFLYPSHVLHAKNATLRLFVYAEHGPLYNHHSYHQCLCSACKDKCKQIRKENETAKQLYYGKILIGDNDLNVDNEQLSWMCSKCKQHCSNTFHLKSGAKNLHIVSNSELSKMETEMQRNDLLSCFVSKKEELQNPLTVEEEEELIQRQPMRVKHVPQLSKQQIIELFSKLPTYKVSANEPLQTESKSAENNKEEETAAAEEEDNGNEKNPEIAEVESKSSKKAKKATPQKSKKTKSKSAKKEKGSAKKEKQAKQEKKDAENKQSKEEVAKEQEAEAQSDGDQVQEAQKQIDDKKEEEEEEAEDMLSFYDISAIVRRVRTERKKDLIRRSVTTQDAVKNGPKNRAKSVGSTALKYTENKRYKLAECQFSDALTSLLHTYTHEIATLNTASETNVTQNVRLLRYLQKDSETNWDSTCCLRKSS